LEDIMATTREVRRGDKVRTPPHTIAIVPAGQGDFGHEMRAFRGPCVYDYREHRADGQKPDPNNSSQPAEDDDDDEG
jgi:hypothetical protein